MQLNNPSKAEVLVTRVNGSIIERRAIAAEASNRPMIMNLSNQAPGIYFIKVITEDGVKISKVVIQR